MANEHCRIRFRCPDCDHPIVTVPERYHIWGKLVCPSCGVTVEPPQAGVSLLEKAEESFSTIFNGKYNGTSKEDHRNGASKVGTHVSRCQWVLPTESAGKGTSQDEKSIATRASKNSRLGPPMEQRQKLGRA